jgi:hypothetical protein
MFGSGTFCHRLISFSYVRSPTQATMKGVVLWANPDRRPLARATNTNGVRMPANRFNVKTGTSAGFKNDHKRPTGSILRPIYLKRIKRNNFPALLFHPCPFREDWVAGLSVHFSMGSEDRNAGVLALLLSTAQSCPDLILPIRNRGDSPCESPLL